MESNEYLNFAKEMCIEAGKIMKKYFTKITEQVIKVIKQ